MDTILHQFLQDPQIKKLYYEAKNNGDEEALKRLNKKFNDYLFEITFVSYLNKTVTLSAKEFYRKNKMLQNREICMLNSPNPATDTKFIDSTPDKSGDFVEEIICNEDSTTLVKHLTNPKLIKAVNMLNDKQKLTIYKSFVEQKSPSEIAKELDIPCKTIRNVKYEALKLLRQWLTSV